MKPSNEEKEINDSPNEIEEKPKESEPENELTRLDSPNNESNEILDKEEGNNNNVIELDSPKNSNKETKKKNFFHDKDITEDSIIYFTNKLKQSNDTYKIFLYSSILLFIIDLFIWYYDTYTFNNYFNLFSIILILLSVISQAYIFRHSFQNISKPLYDLVRKIIYIYSLILVIFLVNIFILLYLEIKNDNIRNNFMDSSIIIFNFIGINIIIPAVLDITLIFVRKSIKNLSAAKGEIYESAKIEDVQVINSIINES